MSVLKTSSVMVCVCCIACSIIGIIAPQGRMKKIVNLVLGAFLVSSMIIPLIGLASTLSSDFYVITDETVPSIDGDLAFEQMILKETADNLVVATNDLLLSEDIKVNNIEIGIKKSENNSIYISRIYIYINEKDKDKAQKISNIILRNMSKEPVIVVSEE